MPLGISTSVGAIPGNVDFGEVQPGTSEEVKLYLRSSDIREEYVVEPSLSEMRSERKFSDNFDGREEVSEENAKEWFDIGQQEIDPNSIIEDPDLDIENPPNVEGVVEVSLDVPEDAEPGYRRGIIYLNPELESEGPSGAGASLIGEARITYQLKVSGRAERDVEITDLRAFRMSEDEVSVEVRLENTGTVTASTSRVQVGVQDSSGNNLATVNTGGSSLEPRESRWVASEWNEDRIDEGRYYMEGEMDYITGEAYISDSVNLPGIDRVEVVPDDSPASEQESNLPSWLVVMILVVLGVLMWSFEIDPVWIFGIIGVLGISGFILISGLSNVLLAGVLIPALLIIYLGV